jgi:hypothetical protein
MQRKTLLATAAVVVVAAGMSAVPLTAMAAEPAAPQQGKEYVATIRSSGGDFRVHLTAADDIEAAFKNLRGEGDPVTHVNGRIDRSGPEVNTGYNWHLDPNDLTFAEASVISCTGDVKEVGTDRWIDPRYCPWESRVTAMDPIN